MSLKTLLQKIGEDISSVFTSTVHELETVILPAAIKVGNALKTITDVDAADIIGHLAGAAGAAIEDKVRASLDNIIPKLQLAQQFVSSGADSATILAECVKLIGNKPIETKSSFWVEFTGALAHDLANAHGMTISDGMMLVQYLYKYKQDPTTQIPPSNGTNG